MEMETTQIKGIDSTVRITKGDLADGASLEVHEKIMTHGKTVCQDRFCNRYERKKTAAVIWCHVRWQRENPDRNSSLL